MKSGWSPPENFLCASLSYLKVNDALQQVVRCKPLDAFGKAWQAEDVDDDLDVDPTDAFKR